MTIIKMCFNVENMLEATTRENSWFSDFQNILLLHSQQHRNLIQMKGYIPYGRPKADMKTVVIR